MRLGRTGRLAQRGRADRMLVEQARPLPRVLGRLRSQARGFRRRLRSRQCGSIRGRLRRSRCRGLTKVKGGLNATADVTLGITATGSDGRGEVPVNVTNHDSKPRSNTTPIVVSASTTFLIMLWGRPP